MVNRARRHSIITQTISSNVSPYSFLLSKSTFNLPLVYVQAASLIIRQYSGGISLGKTFKEFNLLKFLYTLWLVCVVFLTPDRAPNGKDDKNAQHRIDFSECLHTPDAHIRTDMWFTNVKVLCVEYKIYFSSTQNFLLLFYAFSLLSFTSTSLFFNNWETNSVCTLPDQPLVTPTFPRVHQLFRTWTYSSG